MWPGLWDEGEGAEMVPVFAGDGDGGDDDVSPADDDGGEGEGGDRGERERGRVRVGWRMPYDIPLVPYREDEMPWSAEVPCRELDRWGRAWAGYGS